MKLLEKELKKIKNQKVKMTPRQLEKMSQIIYKKTRGMMKLKLRKKKLQKIFASGGLKFLR